jgi:hypothetical protein
MTVSIEKARMHIEAIISRLERHIEGRISVPVDVRSLRRELLHVLTCLPPNGAEDDEDEDY